MIIQVFWSWWPFSGMECLNFTIIFSFVTYKHMQTQDANSMPLCFPLPLNLLRKYAIPYLPSAKMLHCDSYKFSYYFYQGHTYFSTHTAALITKMEYTHIYLNSFSIHYNLQIIKNSCCIHANVTGTSTWASLYSSIFKTHSAPEPDIASNARGSKELL